MNNDRKAVTVKQCGNIIEIRQMTATGGGVIVKISKEQYVDTRTGEIKVFQHNTTRAGNKATVAQSLRNLRDIINANLTEPENALWVTLTYRENMTDRERLYQDFRRFWQRFRYYLAKKNYPAAEYITAAEPQGRGAWHLHCLFLFPAKAPFIPNKTMAKIWQQGFSKPQSLKEIDNPGLYLTAYLSNMELSEAMSQGITKGQLREANTIDDQGKHQKKAIIKGARLHLYPAGFRLFRCSHGVKRPICYQTTEAEAQKIIGNAPLTYEKTITVTDNAGEIKNIIHYRQYNLARKGEDEHTQ